MTATHQPTAVLAPPRRRPAPPPAPTPSRSPRPPLRVVEPAAGPGARRAPRAHTRLLTAAVLVVAAGGLFGLVASHVLLTQGQFRLERLEARAGEAQARYERLRLEVARLESPERIVAAAQERLAMVPPPEVRYLSPSGASAAAAASATHGPAASSSRPGSGGSAAAGTGRDGRGERAAASTEWSVVKRHLAPQR